MHFHDHHDFCSESHKDDDLNDATSKSWVERLHNTVKTAHACKTGRVLRIVFDKQIIDNGDSWMQWLISGVKSARLFISFLDSNYVRNK